ncbi:uncharacterized protein LOC119686073 [Teleopsis dalmanni]|uniref:uncharacterized protein LOC119686073 n=1 Tax=Teleopsis dalmanni TaxID=139649 RepID=UPI0018CE81F9|nr:uncharacterized protein LOC119686073 [Teleopsis dalmanni]
MTQMHFLFWLYLFTLISIKYLHIEAKPASSDTVILPAASNVQRLDKAYTSSKIDSRFTRLRRGYYYVDDDYVDEVPVAYVPEAAKRAAERRQDRTRNSLQYTPVVKYKHTRAKKKKLFVPNFFG